MAPDGTTANTLDTGRGYGGVAGLELDGVGRLLFTDPERNEVIRVEP